MTQLRIRLTRVIADSSAQEMIEYAMLTAFLATAIAAFVPYQTVPAMSHIYSKLVVLCSTLVPQ